MPYEAFLIAFDAIDTRIIVAHGDQREPTKQASPNFPVLPPHHYYQYPSRLTSNTTMVKVMKKLMSPSLRWKLATIIVSAVNDDPGSFFDHLQSSYIDHHYLEAGSGWLSRFGRMIAMFYLAQWLISVRSLQRGWWLEWFAAWKVCGRPWYGGCHSGYFCLPLRALKTSVPL